MKNRRSMGVVFGSVVLMLCCTVQMKCASTSLPSETVLRQSSVEEGKTRETARPEGEARESRTVAGVSTTSSESEVGPAEAPRDEIVDLDSRSRITGRIRFDITDIAGRRLASRIELRDAAGGFFATVEAPTGIAVTEVPVGSWRAYVSVIDDGVPVLVEVADVLVRSGESAVVPVRLLEGASGKRGLRAFDRDFDLALDRVELEEGTDPENAASLPGTTTIEWPSPVLSSVGRWYRGELHAHSRYGIGSESVGALIRRAERQGLDFLAITDRNTIQSAFDPEYRSSSLVLIPAMEWGTDAMGIGLVYAPRSIPKVTDSMAFAQAIAIRVQAQGGLFMAAHPCFSTAPWQWGLSYLNGVEVWCRSWRQVPPLWLDRLDPPAKVRKKGKLIRSIALASATEGYSANGQASLFYDYELTRGLKAAVIAGSYSVGPEIPLGRPLTYVFANEKSLNGILDGLRWGRTFVSNGKEGPKVVFSADILDDGTTNTGVGGYVPLNVRSRFRVEVEDAEGATLQILLNGRVFRSKKIRWKGDFRYEFVIVPEAYSVYRVRIVGTPSEKGFGIHEMLAMTSPIYALELIPNIPGAGDNIWLKLKNEFYRPGNSDQFIPGNPDTDTYRTITPRFTL